MSGLTEMEVLVARYVEHLRVRGYAETTTKTTESTLGFFAAWCAERGLERPGEVTFPMLQRYQRHLFYLRGSDGRPLSFRTQALRLSHLKGFFRWLVRERRVLYNPASEIELPRYERRLPREVLTVSEVETVLGSVDVSEPLGIRDRAILEVFYSTGLRRGEVIGLEVYDVEPERGWVTVQKGKGGKDRVVPIGDRALAWVLAYVDRVRGDLVVSPEEAALFLTYQGERFSADGMTRLVKRYLERSGVRASGACHLFRHTAATVMLENGADIRYIQEMLGHAKLETTQIYTQVAIHKLKAIHSATHPGAPLGREGVSELLDDPEPAAELEGEPDPG